jgi:phosphomevalonate kinase
VIVLAPGKLLVTGAYAVLEGATALVLAVDRYARASASGIDTSALYENGQKLGLGSSAASLVAKLGREAALGGADLGAAEVRARIFANARDAHAAEQSGGSGVDVAAAVHGGALAYTMREGARPVKLPAGVVFDAFWSGASARTSDMRARVDALRARDRARYDACIDALAGASATAVAACEEDDARGLVQAVRAAARGLADLGAAADAAIVPPGFERMARAAEAEGAAFLPSGAGGGDVGLYLGMQRPGARLLHLAREVGMTPLGVALDAAGVRRRG